MRQTGRVALLGGDRRMLYAAAFLLESGVSLRAWGLGKEAGEILGDAVTDGWQEAIAGADVLVLPLPASRDGVRVFAPSVEETASPRLSLLASAFEGRAVLGGRLEGAVEEAFLSPSRRVIDYFEDESLCLQNALLTAEGAIALAMQELPVSLFGSEVAVAGYGRIGSLLAKALSALGAHVSVLARRREVLTLAELEGHRAIPLDVTGGTVELSGLSKKTRVLFNTVPSRIFSPRALSAHCPGCLFLDLASAPGGIDHAEAHSCGIRTVWGTALPGKYAPETAGRAVGQTLLSLLQSLMKGE